MHAWFHQSDFTEIVAHCRECDCPVEIINAGYLAIDYYCPQCQKAMNLVRFKQRERIACPYMVHAT